VADQVSGLVSWAPLLRAAEAMAEEDNDGTRADSSPGKVYTLGPGETFANFEVHLRNKAHIEKRAGTGRK